MAGLKSTSEAAYPFLLSCNAYVDLGYLNMWSSTQLVHFFPNEFCRQEVQGVEQQRVKEKQALKQKEEEAEVRWHSPLRNKHEHEVQQIERPWTIAALSIPEHVAVCAVQRNLAQTAACMPLLAWLAERRAHCQTKDLGRASGPQMSISTWY